MVGVLDEHCKTELTAPSASSFGLSVLSFLGAILGLGYRRNSMVLSLGSLSSSSVFRRRDVELRLCFG